MTKVLAFSGSVRQKSYNQAVAKTAAKGAELGGASVTVVNLADYPMPLFNEDEEALTGIPEKAKEFKELLKSHDAFLIASPEYNSSYPALLKNAIDWASRKEQGEKPLEAFKGKPVAIFAASEGALGGMRVLVVLRMLLSNIGMHVLPNQRAIGKVQTLVDEQGDIVDEKAIKQIHQTASDLVAFANKLA